MTVITLKELISLNRQRSSPLANFQPSELSRQQQQFQLLVRQIRLPREALGSLPISSLST